MKTLIPILTFMILVLSSCEKTYCWHCTTYLRNNNQDIGTTLECGYSEDMISDKENAMTDDTQYYLCEKASE